MSTDVSDRIAVAGQVVLSQQIFQKKILKIQWFIILSHVFVNKEDILGSHILSMEIWGQWRRYGLCMHTLRETGMHQSQDSAQSMPLLAT
jgi:hypothetical protein